MSNPLVDSAWYGGVTIRLVSYIMAYTLAYAMRGARGTAERSAGSAPVPAARTSVPAASRPSGPEGAA